MSFEAKIKQLGLVIPPAPVPVGSYRPVIFSQQLAFLSGQIAKMPDGKLITGAVGSDLTLEDGQKAARLAAVNVLSVIQHGIGFARFVRLVRLVGYVQAAPHFHDIPKVINAASDLFIEVFGDAGTHARSAVGVPNLPLNSAVELELTLEIR